MRRLLRLLLLFLFADALVAAGAGGNTALGLMLGEPSAITIKHMLNEKNGIDGGAGLSVIEGQPMIFGDFFWQFPQAIKKDGTWPTYLGPGLAIASLKYDNSNNKFGDKNGHQLHLGVRGLFGMEFRPPSLRFSFHLDISLNLYFVPSSHAQGGLALGARYWL